MHLINGWAAVMRNGERKSWLIGKGEKQEGKDSWVMMGLWWYWVPIFLMKQEAWSNIVYLSPFVILLFKKWHSESAFHLHSKPQFSSLLSSSDRFLHIQQPPWGQNRDLWLCSPTKGDTFQQLCDLGGWPEHMPFESQLKESWGHAALLRVSRWKK